MGIEYLEKIKKATQTNTWVNEGKHLCNPYPGQEVQLC